MVMPNEDALREVPGASRSEGAARLQLFDGRHNFGRHGASYAVGSGPTRAGIRRSALAVGAAVRVSDLRNWLRACALIWPFVIELFP